MAMMVAINTGFSISFESNITMPCADEPNTFLTPISLIRFAAVNEARPNKPRHAIKIASPENILNMVCCLKSVLYNSSNFWSKKLYSNE